MRKLNLIFIGLGLNWLGFNVLWGLSLENHDWTLHAGGLTAHFITLGIVYFIAKYFADRKQKKDERKEAVQN